MHFDLVQDFALSHNVFYLLISDNGPFTLQFHIEKTYMIGSLICWVMYLIEILNIASKSEYGIIMQPLISGFDTCHIKTGVGASTEFVFRLTL